MKIAILGWGSLIWDPRELPHYGPWQVDGPSLPIEFSRVSRDGRLTLVIDPSGPECRTQFVLSPRVDMAEAVEDLRQREGTLSRHIGYLSKAGAASWKQYHQQPNIGDRVHGWLATHGYDACVWTALLPNFSDEVGSGFAPDSAVNYLRGLPKSAREVALRYIRNAPEEIDTPTRRAVAKEWPPA